MRVLVTGATGSIGSAVVDRLAGDGHSVRVLVRGDASPAAAEEIVRADVTDKAAVRAAVGGAEAVVHCAASVSSDLAEALRVNVDGTRNITESLLLEQGRPAFVHISTLSVYDDAVGPTYDEDSALWTAPDSAYGFTKAEAERVVLAGVARGLRAIILRPTAVLSMHERARWGPLAIQRARAATACLVPFPELPYVHVDDLAGAVVRAIAASVAPGRAYNVIDAVADTREYLAAVYAAAGRAPHPIPADAPRLRFAAERIRRELAWTPAADRWRPFLEALRAYS
jgi:nucleoside-diphosphate-sugar epimerase